MKPPVNKSSQIDCCAHDPETNKLSVRFKSGATYHYAGVPAEHHEGLMNAESPGKYLNEQIKAPRHEDGINPKYPFVRAEDEEGATS